MPSEGWGEREWEGKRERAVESMNGIRKKKGGREREIERCRERER